VLKNVLVLLVSSISATRTKTRKYPGGTIQTKHFIHDVNQQVEMVLSIRNSIKKVNRAVPEFTTDILEDGGDRRDRTDDLKLAKLPLYQLSYVPSLLSSQTKRVVPRRNRMMVGLGRLELPTSRLSSARSNQLSYRPDKELHPVV
jgi:hypothetical protein